MNPPFGVQKNKADRLFLKQAFMLSDVIYSIHITNKDVQKFLLSYSSKFNWKVDYELPFNMVLEKSFYFHTKKRKQIDVSIYRFTKDKEENK
jgi:putative methylase